MQSNLLETLDISIIKLQAIPDPLFLLSNLATQYLMILTLTNPYLIKYFTMSRINKEFRKFFSRKLYKSLKNLISLTKKKKQCKKLRKK